MPASIYVDYEPFDMNEEITRDGVAAETDPETLIRWHGELQTMVKELSEASHANRMNGIRSGGLAYKLTAAMNGRTWVRQRMADLGVIDANEPYSAKVKRQAAQLASQAEALRKGDEKRKNLAAMLVAAQQEVKALKAEVKRLSSPGEGET